MTERSADELAAALERLEDDGLGEALAAQVRAVDARVAGPGVYTHESTEVRRAALAVPVLRRRLRLSRYIRNLAPPTAKPQFILLFEGPANGRADQGGRECVLKVYGRLRPTESALQSRWYDEGLPTPRVLASGNDPVSWLLLEHVPASPLPMGTKDEVLQCTRELAGIMRRVHVCGRPGTGPSSLADRVLPHLAAVVPSLVGHGYRPPAQWRSAAAAAYAAGREVTLHGDLFPGNLLHTQRGLLLIDACGYSGDASFDAARWAVRVADARCSAEEILACWQEVEELDVSTARLMLGVESLMQAGVREILKDETGQHVPGQHDPRTAGLLGDCARHWSGT